MQDYGSYRVPREVEMGREVRVEKRRNTHRLAIFGIAGFLVLCACLSFSVCGAAFALGLNPFADSNGQASINVFGSNSTPTPRASANGAPTSVPYGKNGKNDSGLRVTVTSFQRPLPAQDVEIPQDQELVLVSVRIDNSRTTGGPIKFDPEDFALVSPEGDHFAPNIGGITTGENLAAGELAAGKSAKGDLVFYVYQDVKDLQLAWTSSDGKTRLFNLSRSQ